MGPCPALTAPPGHTQSGGPARCRRPGSLDETLTEPPAAQVRKPPPRLLSSGTSTAASAPSANPLGVLQGLLHLPRHPVDRGLSLPFGQEVGLVQHHDQLLAGNLPNHEALGRLGLHPLGHVDDQHHHVDDLGPWGREDQVRAERGCAWRPQPLVPAGGHLAGNAGRSWFCNRISPSLNGQHGRLAGGSRSLCARRPGS